MALTFGFSHAFPKNVPVTLHFTFAGEHAAHDERMRIAAEADRQANRCRTPDRLTECTPKRPFPPSHAPHPPLRHHSVRLVWEYLTKTGTWTALDPAKNEVIDETRALTLNGRVRLTLPTDDMDTMSLGVEGLSQYAVRCRCHSGMYDAPPRLQSVVLNGLRVEQAGRWQDGAEQVGSGSGLPEQVVKLGETAVLPSTLHLHTLEKNGRQTWQQRDDFNGSTPADAHFLLDATTGVITFGDGNRGRVVPKHAPIMATYRATQAAAGNLKANTITVLADTPHNQALLTNFSQIMTQIKQITNPLPAGGGTPAETVDQATGRALILLEQPQRTVTADDFVMLAYETPGVRIARAAAWINQHPDFPCFKAPGMITLIVMPFLPADRPMPSAALRQQVAAYLNARRVVGSRVEIVGPTYTEVGVEASVRACAGVNLAALQQQIVANLDRFLHPLTGGPDGNGWPFGRDVVRSEVLQVIDETPGVEYVLSLTLRSDGCDPVCGNVCLGPRGLVAAKTHEIKVV
jgi:predicted phage baseplate assembly protein